MHTLWLTIMVLLALPSWAAEQTATTLYYRMGEPGVDPYLSRMLVTADYLRIDEGNSEDNYILFDRKRHTVYSVVHGDRTVLEIPFRPVDKKPQIELDRDSRVVRGEKMPTIGGKTPVHRELRVNGNLCYSTISVAEILPDAVAVLREYRTVMAGEHAKNIENTPIELQEPCDLTLHIFSPLWLLEFGLPIQEWSPQGRSTQLLNYNNEERVDSTLFTLPNDYRRYQTSTGQ